MTANSKSDQDRWRELADLLGLPAEDRSTSVPLAPQPASAEPPLRLEPARTWPAASRDETPPVMEERTPPSGLSTQEGATETAVPEAMPERSREEDRPRRGRRGRGRRASPEDAAGAETPEIASAAASAEPGSKHEEDQDQPPRGRRGRRKPSRPDVGPSAGEATAETEDEDISDDYAKWNLPSWEELIASLKRP